MKSIVILGSGLAGYNAAREIRKLDSNIPIHMITQDGGAFYSKPQLSTALAHNKTADALMAMSAEKMATTQNMTIDCHETITAIHPHKNSIERDGEMIEYAALILALGADTPNPPIQGDATDAILHVNDVYQYDAFRQVIADKKHITILGAGLVGCEFANDLALSGFDVSVIDLEKHALPKLLPNEVSQHLQTALRDKGVSWHFNQKVERIDHDQGQLLVTISNDQAFHTDVVLCAIGLKPRTALAKTAGIHINQGITVDSHLKTNIDNIYALGDCAEIGGMVLPYVQPILHCAKVIAKNVTGEPAEIHYPAMPVVIKTTCYPICVCTPHTAGKWEINADGDTVRAKFTNSDGQLTGFVLTKEAVKERMQLSKDIPDWL